MHRVFTDRLEAGRLLAQALSEYRGTDAVVLGMARGGVAVGYAVSEALHLPLQALVVRKVGSAVNPELAIGAVSETGALWLDQGLSRATGSSRNYVEAELQRQRAEAARRQQEYGVEHGLQQVQGRQAIVVDDGIATGASALVAVRSARDLGASRVVLAAPVASPQSVGMLSEAADRVVVLDRPSRFYAVGLYYRDFEQVSDAEVIRYLEAARQTVGT